MQRLSHSLALLGAGAGAPGSGTSQLFPSLTSSLGRGGRVVRGGVLAALGAAAIGFSCPAAAQSVSPDSSLSGARDQAQSPVLRESGSSDRDEVAAFCRYRRAAQRSEAARLRSPWLAARGTTLQRDELASGGDDSLTLRVRAGVGFSVSDWLRADATEERAEAECATRRAELATRSRDSSIEALALEGFEEKARLLSKALPEGAVIVRESEAQLERNERTIGDHLRVLHAYQALNKQSSDALSQVARLTDSVAPEPLDPDLALRLQSSVAGLERAAGKLRRNEALSVTLEAGYDDIVGIDQDLPVYAEVIARFRPGQFWQGSADEESARARAHAARLALQTRERAYAEAVQRAWREHSVVVEEAQRLRSFLVTLAQQRDALLKTGNREASFIAQELWFELESGRAELARLEGTARAIERWSQSRSSAIGGEPGSTAEPPVFRAPALSPAP